MSEYTAPEVREQGLQAAGQRSDIFSLCRSLSILFAGREDSLACQAQETLALGTVEEPSERRDLASIRNAIDELLGRPVPLPPAPPAQDWDSGQDVPFGGNLYRVRDRVGSGGVGVTFEVDKVRGSDGQLVGPYSGKVVTDAALGPQVLASYEQVRPHARHPLAAVLETAPEWAANSFVAIMRWVDGSTLLDIADYLQEQALELGEPSAEALALRWLSEVCDGLETLHRNGLCHGDVSPSNLIASGRSLVLTDYDLAGKTGEPAASPGTMEYCAPESRKGSPRSASNDIYALAASIFHAFVDRKPFRSKGDLIKEQGLNWSEAERSAFPAIAPFLDRATDPDPERRFASASEALAALREISVVPPVEEPAEPEQSPVEVAKPAPDQDGPAPEPTGPVQERRSWLAWVAALGCVAVAGLLAWILWDGGEGPEIRARSLTNSIGMEFLWIPPGTFEMGSVSREAEGDERPVTSVRLANGFYMGKHEVTQGQWMEVMGSNPSEFDECGPDCPVERVSWEAAQAFIRRLNDRESDAGGHVYRLPTAAEWEYAARGGTRSDRYGAADLVAWHAGNSGGRTHPVGGMQENMFGLHDMLGNVWEWVQDSQWKYPGGEVSDPSGGADGARKLYRGGSWHEDPSHARAPSRWSGPPAVYNDRLGFRLVWSD